MSDENDKSQPDAMPAGDGQIIAEVAETDFDTVISRVLDAGEVANRTAAIAADSTEHLISAVAQLRKANEQSKIHAVIVLGLTGVLMLSAVGVFFLMARQLHESLEAADAAVLAVGKRILQLNSGVQYLKDIQASVEGLEQRIESQSAAVEKIGAKVDGALADLRKSNADLVEKLPKAADSKSVNPIQAQLQSQSQAINQIQSALAQLKSSENGLREVTSQVQGQSKAIQKLSEQVAAVQNNAARIGGIAHNVETIMALEKQRASPVSPSQPAPAVSAAPAASPAPVKKERAEQSQGVVRYPRVAVPDSGKPATADGTIVSPPRSDGAH